MSDGEEEEREDWDLERDLDRKGVGCFELEKEGGLDVL